MREHGHQRGAEAHSFRRDGGRGDGRERVGLESFVGPRVGEAEFFGVTNQFVEMTVVETVEWNRDSQAHTCSHSQRAARLARVTFSGSAPGPNEAARARDKTDESGRDMRSR